MTDTVTSALPWAHLESRLAARRKAGLLRQRRTRTQAPTPRQYLDGRERLTFCSNDYLGLAAHPEVIAGLKSAADRYGVGSSGSHMITGHCDVHQQLEDALAEFLQRDRVLLFSTGYMANTGIIHALMQRGGLVLQDALNHASLLDGGWLSRAASQRFAHRDLQDLSLALDSARADHVLVATDGLFSMDGDLAPLQEMIPLCRQHRALLLVDDAHGIGCLGEGGRGTVEQLAPPGEVLGQADVPLLVGTLGKAFGTAGAFVAGDAALIGYLEQFARSHVYTTALPPALASASLISLRLIREEPWRRQRLQDMVQRFRDAAGALGLTLTDSRSPVQGLILGDADRAVRASALLDRLGLQVTAIRPPSVPHGGARLRITFSAAHSDAQVDRLLSGLELLSVRLDQL